MAKVDENNKVHIDTRIVFKGAPGEFLKEKIEEVMSKDSRKTYGHAVEAILLKHFKWDKK